MAVRIICMRPSDAEGNESREEGEDPDSPLGDASEELGRADMRGARAGDDDLLEAPATTTATMRMRTATMTCGM